MRAAAHTPPSRPARRTRPASTPTSARGTFQCTHISPAAATAHFPVYAVNVLATQGGAMDRVEGEVPCPDPGDVVHPPPSVPCRNASWMSRSSAAARGGRASTRWSRSLRAGLNAASSSASSETAAKSANVPAKAAAAASQSDPESAAPSASPPRSASRAPRHLLERSCPGDDADRRHSGRCPVRGGEGERPAARPAERRELLPAEMVSQIDRKTRDARQGGRHRRRR